MKREFRDALDNSPIIAAIKDDEGLKSCKDIDSSIIFILYGDICTIPEIVATVKDILETGMVLMENLLWFILI